MRLFSKGLLTKDQIKRITDETGCSKESASERAEIANSNDVQIGYFMDNQLYRMTPKELSKYLSTAAPRRYIEAVEWSSDDAPDYEIYQQMKRAKKDYGISYRTFVQERLLDADDERLKKVRQRIEQSNDEAISMIAGSLDISNSEAQEIVDGIKAKFGYSAKEINKRRLYAMTEAEIAEWKEGKKKHQKEILDRVVQESGLPKHRARAHMSHCLIDFGIASDMYLSIKCFDMQDWQLALCANTRDSKKLSERFNEGHRELLDEKDGLHGLLDEYMGRKYWMNREASFEDFKEFAEGLQTVFCKPLDSMAGHGAYKYDLAGRSLEEAYDHFMEQPGYLIEECVEQHPEMAKFYPGSVNTVRVIAVLDDGEFDPFLAVARFGTDGVIDNFSSGGIACAVDPENGMIVSNGCNKQGDVFDVHPVTGVKFKGFSIPHWDKVLENAESALREIDGINYVGWDFAITDDGVVIIEGNARSGFTAPQTTWYTEGELIRDRYYRHLGTQAYDDMLIKVADAMKAHGISEDEAVDRLTEAFNQGLEYDFVKREGICGLDVDQIRIYSSDAKIRDLVGQIAQDANTTVAEAFLKAASDQ